MEITKKYKILAFTTLVKKYRRNSLIYQNDKVNYAKAIGFSSYNTYKKYKNICIDLGILIPVGNHYQVINLMNVLEILEIKNKFTKHHHFCHTFEYKELTFKNVYEHILQSLLTVNYQQQEYNLERNKILFSRSKDDSIKQKKYQLTISLVRRASKEGIDTDTLLKYISSRKINKIVSGKFHVSNLIGFSASSGLRWLKKLKDQGIIKRRVIIKYTESKDALKHFNFHFKRISQTFSIPTSNGFKTFLGSSIKVKNVEVKGIVKVRESHKKGTNLTIKK